jgi:UDP-N-acetylmuramoyl-tripeptide--D-alanyl-D-alanine ligase
VLGDMAELGSDARSYHQEVGEYAKEQNIDVLLTLGVLSQNTSDAFNRQGGTIGEHFNDREMLEDFLFNILKRDKDNKNTKQILVKGSRSAHMEYVVENIINWHAKQHKESQSLSSNILSHNIQDNS